MPGSSDNSLLYKLMLLCYDPEQHTGNKQQGWKQLQNEIVLCAPAAVPNGKYLTSLDLSIKLLDAHIWIHSASYYSGIAQSQKNGLMLALLSALEPVPEG